MDYVRWTLRLISDILHMGHANGSYALAFAILLLLVAGVVVVGAQASAPFIYTLF